ncbi:MAG: nitroreductase family protein [Methylococcales bacterium]
MRTIIKKLIPRPVKQAVRDGINSLRIAAVPFFANSKFSALTYYKLLSNSFANEQNGVLVGINKHLNTPIGQYYRLVRNIHRLEKGLCMVPRKDVFALDYIDETVSAFAVLANEAIKFSDQLNWASGVLNKYFSEVEANDQQYITAKAQFWQIINRHQLAIGNDKTPYPRGMQVDSAVNYASLKDLSVKRRSVRWYLPHAVPRELLDQAVQVATLAPSACNRQPFEFRIYDQPELKDKIINIPGGTTGWSHNAPVVIAVVGNLSAYCEEHDRHLIYIDSSLAAMALMYALETLGLSSCAINFPDTKLNNAGAKQHLSLQTDEKVIMLISVGYADPNGLIPYSQKKTIDQLRSFNKL